MESPLRLPLIRVPLMRLRRPTDKPALNGICSLRPWHSIWKRNGRLAEALSMSRKRNVLIMVDSFDIGGAEGQAILLARLLLEDGRYGVHLGCLRRQGA